MKRKGTAMFYKATNAAICALLLVVPVTSQAQSGGKIGRAHV